MKPIRAIIADDEKELRTYLKAKLARVWPELQICGEAGNGKEALALVETAKPDIAFLDIRMPGLSGLEVAERILGKCRVVFTTAYDQYAVAAFEKEAVDYLLKPVDDKRLARTADRLRLCLYQNNDDRQTLSKSFQEALSTLIHPPAQSHLQWIRAQQGNKITLVPVADIICFQSGDKYTAVVTKTAEFLIRKPIKTLEQELDPEKFWRIHRGTIVNVACIDKVSRSLTGKYVVRIRDMPDPLMVSRTYADQFRQM